jgi:hypothetical protein
MSTLFFHDLFVKDKAKEAYLLSDVFLGAIADLK